MFASGLVLLSTNIHANKFLEQNLFQSKYEG